MTFPKVTVCGAYRLDPPTDLFSYAMQLKFADGFESPSERQAAEDHVHAELQGVVLLEVSIQHCDQRFRVDDFSQAGSDQAPYDEVFLTEDGSAVAAELTGKLDRVGQSVRVAFYFHFFDQRKPLNTSYGPVTVPAIEPMPTRLGRLVPYEPVT
jgi:hypothetical protein